MVVKALRSLFEIIFYHKVAPHVREISDGFLNWRGKVSFDQQYSSCDVACSSVIKVSSSIASALDVGLEKNSLCLFLISSPLLSASHGAR